jgi:cation transport regulator ChaB
MPFKSTKELPDNIKKFSPKLQRQYLAVWNNVFKKTKSEARAFKAANSILKKRFIGKKSMENNSRHDYVNMLVEKFLGNLNG